MTHPNEVYCEECLSPPNWPCVDGYEISSEGKLISICANYHEKRVLAAQLQEKYEAAR